MRFCDLKVGDTFEFEHSESLKLLASGIATGPWVKTSARRYVSRQSAGGYSNGYTVSSVDAPVRKVGDEEWPGRVSLENSDAGGRLVCKTLLFAHYVQSCSW